MNNSVYLKNGYSDRKGITEFKDIIQFESLNERTRNKIYSYLMEYIDNSDKKYKSQSLLNLNIRGFNTLIKYIYIEVFSLNIDDIPIEYNLHGGYINRFKVSNDIKNTVLESSYDEVFTFIESIEKVAKINNHSISDYINFIFKEECVQHRLIDGIITDLTNENEIKELEQSLSQNNVCTQHFDKAINYLYNRDKPDYENSVKESISAIESLCNIIIGEKGATLGEALKKLEGKGIKIHGALESAYIKLYGYASDESGIRHSNGLDMSTTFEEAKYMLISCSAFYNYLVSINEKANQVVK